MTEPTPRDLASVRIVESESELLPHDDSVRGKTVVDVGCGTGELVRWFFDHGARAVGLETSSMVAKARASHPEIAGSFVEGAGESLPFDNGIADVVLFLASLHHVPESKMLTALSEATRVLKPGGLLIVIEPVAADGSYSTLTNMVDDESQLRDAAEDAIGRHEELDLEMVSESHFAFKRTLADFRVLLRDHVDDKHQRNDSIRQAEDVTTALAASRGVQREAYTYLSICRRTILRKRPLEVAAMTHGARQ